MCVGIVSDQGYIDVFEHNYRFDLWVSLKFRIIWENIYL